jgi:hypothetical protein
MHRKNVINTPQKAIIILAKVGISALKKDQLFASLKGQ